MNETEEIRKACEALRSSINATFDRLFLILDEKERGETEVLPTPTEYVYPLTADTSIFIGKKPIAVLFGEERVEANNWRKVFAAVLSRCNTDAECHEMLMYLRNKAGGQVRVFLSDNPDGMRRPLRVDEDMYAETHYGSATLMHILVNRILAPAHFDCSNISIVIKPE